MGPPNSSKPPSSRPDLMRSTAPAAPQKDLNPDDQWKITVEIVVKIARNASPEAEGTLPPGHEVPMPHALQQDDPEDSVRLFLVKRCSFGSTSTVKMGDLYAAYRTWCHAQGIRPLTLVKVSRCLTLLGFPKLRRHHTGVWRRGVTLDATKEENTSG